MPTFNQLVRKGRQKAEYRSSSRTAKAFNSLKNREVDLSSPQKRGVCTVVKTATPKPTRSA